MLFLWWAAEGRQHCSMRGPAIIRRRDSGCSSPPRPTSSVRTQTTPPMRRRGTPSGRLEPTPCKNKFVDWGVALPCISMALVGSFAGAHIALLASDKILKWMLIPVLPIVAFYVMKKKNLDDNSNVEISRKKQWILCAVCSLAVGCYDGFYGPGTGTFLLILYTGVAKLPVAKASGTMKLANLSSNIMALVVFLFSGKIVIYLGLAASVFSIAGHYVGSGMVMKNGNKIVRPIILIVLVLLFIKIITGM